ncbi:retrovirus-related pol polyprotein from transposon TNT 1-94 [Tanacetum coccineum]
MAEFPQIESDLAVPVFKQGDDPIVAINKMMSFLSTVVSSHFPTTNNQLRNSSNLRQQVTIHDGRVIVQPVQERQSQQRVVKSFNCQGEDHMARQCLNPKRKRDATRFRDKVLLVEAQGSGKVLNEEELEFLAEPGVAEGPITQIVITHNVVYQADDLDAYDSNCDDFSIAKAVLMANLSSYGSDVLSEYLLETQNAAVQYTNSFAQQDAMILFVFEKQSNQVTNYNKVNKDNLISNESLSAELAQYKERVKLLEERQNVDLSFQNPFYLKKAQQIRPMLYDGSVIAKETNVISIADSKVTLMLEEESQSKMLLKQSDPKVLEKKVNIKPINYAELNRLSKDFGKRFIPQQELSDEHAFRLQPSHPNTDQFAPWLVKIEAPRELSKVILINTSLKKLKYHLDQFDNVVKKRITPDALTKGEWGFEHCSMFDARHELCFLKFVSEMNVCSKSKSVKKAKKKEEWKPTGKVFTKIGYNWRPTGRTFTLVRNSCPLTRITATNEVPLREPIPLEVGAQDPVVTKVYTRRPKVPKTIGSNSKSKIAKSMISNKTKPGTSRGSNTSVAPSSSSLVNLRPMRVARINGKKYILVIVDDYSRFTWVKFLASKDEAPDFITKFLKMIQVRLNATVKNIRTYNGTEFVNQTLCSYYESVGISHETSVARTQQC